MTSPKISVITPTKNSARDIEICLKSVASQGFIPKEHLIIDSVSTDGTQEIVRAYQKKYRHIRMISEKDSGIYDAMNKGLTMARGEWIFFLGSDDELFDSSVLKDINGHLREDTDFLYGDVSLKSVLKRYGGKFTFFRLQIMNICQQSIFYRRSIFDSIGTFDTTFTVSADWDFNLRCFKNPQIRRRHINRVIARYALTGYSAGKIDFAFISHRLFGKKRHVASAGNTPSGEPPGRT